jgi:hypothetical protein
LHRVPFSKRYSKPAGWQLRSDTSKHCLRVDGGRHEVDLLIEFDDRVLTIEVKLSADVDDDVRQLRWLRVLVGDRLGAYWTDDQLAAVGVVER